MRWAPPSCWCWASIPIHEPNRFDGNGVVGDSLRVFFASWCRGANHRKSGQTRSDSSGIFFFARPSKHPTRQRTDPAAVFSSEVEAHEPSELSSSQKTERALWHESSYPAAIPST
jgi:hypothetical protein